MTEEKSFKGKYRIKSSRLEGWDYSLNGAYYITICTKNKEYFFGEIKNEKIVLSEIGRMAEKYWKGIPEHFPFVKLDEFVVMPNNIHGILFIENENNMHVYVETQDFESLQQTKHYKNKFGTQSKNVSSVVRGFKIGVKTYATMNNIHFTWQSRFYDHIIRNENELNKIREYIIGNPKKWILDKDTPEDLYT